MHNFRFERTIRLALDLIYMFGMGRRDDDVGGMAFVIRCGTR